MLGRQRSLALTTVLIWQLLGSSTKATVCHKCGSSRMAVPGHSIFVQQEGIKCTSLENVFCNNDETLCIYGIFTVEAHEKGHLHNYTISGCHKTSLEFRHKELQTKKCAFVQHTFRLGRRALPGWLHFCICDKDYCNDRDFVASLHQPDVAEKKGQTVQVPQQETGAESRLPSRSRLAVKANEEAGEILDENDSSVDATTLAIAAIPTEATHRTGVANSTANVSENSTSNIVLTRSSNNVSSNASDSFVDDAISVADQPIYPVYFRTMTSSEIKPQASLIVRIQIFILWAMTVSHLSDRLS